MKRILALFIAVISLVLCGCQESAENIGVFKGGKQFEKRALRFINIDGELYFDSGFISDMTPRCGTLDGQLYQSANAHEIPHESGSANFEADGYQNASKISKEVPIDGKWVIFKKFDGNHSDIGNYKYCYYIKGFAENGEVEGEFAVLSATEDITFDDVYKSMFDSRNMSQEQKCKFSWNRIDVHQNKFGLNMAACNITPLGLTLKIEQFDNDSSKEYITGDHYELECMTDSGMWESVPTVISGEAGCNDIAHVISHNDITQFDIQWEWLYGSLEPGFYSLSKEVTIRKDGFASENQLLSAYFTIE